MSTDLEQQLARFAAGLDRDASMISFDEVVGRGAVVVVGMDALEHPTSDAAAGEDGISWIDAMPDHQTDERDGLIELAPALVVRRPAWRGASLKVALGVAAAAVLVVSLAAIERDHDDSSFADELTSTFVSPRNGFSIKLPEGAVVTPAVQLWGWSERPDDWFDVLEIDSGAVFRGTSATEFPDGNPCNGGPPAFDEIPCGSIDDQVDRHLGQEHLQFDGCGVPRSEQAEITIDGESARIATCSNHIEATVVTPGGLYLFTLSHDLDDARAVFEALAATIELTPETALSFAAMTTTFVSPTYGLSFKHFDRGGDTPATEPWDPTHQPVAPAVRGAFDELETGAGAIFAAASTAIPDGVSVDAWADELVTPRAADGCGVPRSTQAAITIDGHPARTTECRRRTEATVVAGERLYLFVMWYERPNPRWFEAWLATIDLTPETATAP